VCSKCAQKHTTHLFGRKNEFQPLCLENFRVFLQLFTKKKIPLLLTVQCHSLTKETVSGCPTKGTRRTIDNSLVVILQAAHLNLFVLVVVIVLERFNVKNPHSMQEMRQFEYKLRVVQ